MNESIFEEKPTDVDATAETPVDEDENEIIDTPENNSDLSGDKVPHPDFLKFLSEMRGIIPDLDDNEDEDEDEDEDYCDMDADELHNKAVDRARRGRNREAAEICIKGLKRFSLNADLLADTIKYSSEAGDMQTAGDYYSMLKDRLPFRCWNWRAFTFSFDYLMKEDPIANENECRTIIAKYKEFLPYEEKSSLAESELEAALGNTEVSMDVLKEAIRTHTNACQCALRLADMQMDRGLFKDVLVTTNYGIAASAETQPSINIPYLYYIRALAKDYFIHKKECSGETITGDEIEALKNEYELLISQFPELMCHSRMINMRLKMLKFIKTN